MIQDVATAHVGALYPPAQRRGSPWRTPATRAAFCAAFVGGAPAEPAR